MCFSGANGPMYLSSVRVITILLTNCDTGNKLELAICNSVHPPIYNLILIVWNLTMKLSLLFVSVAIATSLTACGGGGDAPAPAPVPTPAPTAAAAVYTFTSTTTPSVTFSSTAPGTAAVAIGERFKVTSPAGVSNSSSSLVSGTCSLSINSITASLYEVSIGAACVRSFTFSNGSTSATVTVTAK
jgi:hypothetical protein